MDRGKSPEIEGIVRLHVRELQKLTGKNPGNATIFEPQSTIQKRDSSITNPESPSTSAPAIRAPEKKLTLFALRLAVLEKAATGLGTLGFIWATVVLLGGFAITLDKTDFWFITIILLIEGTRIFSRSHELEWQHQATWSITNAGISSYRALRSSSRSLFGKMKSIFRPFSAAIKQGSYNRDIKHTRTENNRGMIDRLRLPTRTWKTSEVPLFPYGQWFFLSRNVSKILYWLQLLSATACVVLSSMKLIRRNFGEVEKDNTDKRNREAALLIFYALALAEALLFLIEKAYWEWKVIFQKVLQEVNDELDLGASGMISIKRFFYDSYSRCVNGSVFDGLKMDMVSFAMELLASDSPDEQLVGIRTLRLFVQNERFSDDTLQKIGITLSVIERLVEMLNWKDPQEEEIRLSAAEILSKLAGKKQSSLRVAGIPGVMESISSLLQTNATYDCSANDHPSYAYWKFNHLGLVILKKLARDHDNCGKIGNTRGLLPKIVDFTQAEERVLKDENIAPSQIETIKRSLQVMMMLAGTSGSTGKQLRKEMSEIVCSISNLRDILRFGEKHPTIQKLGTEILTSLALEEDATETIGGTGGVLKELFSIFFRENVSETYDGVKIAAGEAIAALALESKSNCHRILKLNVLEKLGKTLESPLIRVNSARILRNLCSYSGSDSFDKLKRVANSSPTILRGIASEEDKLQEVMVGLAAHVFKFMSSEESSIMFERAGLTEAELAKSLVQILKKHKYPATTTPRIRRFTIETSIWMMKEDPKNVQIFKELEMEKELEGVLETTSEIESFSFFSGPVGVSRHRTTMHSLVETALNLLGLD